MTIETIGKRVFIYVRVSTQEQAKDGYSIEEQIERLKKYCEAHGYIIVKIYTDAGYSGSNMDRPALQEMIKDIEDQQGDSVLVYKLDRLSRSQKDTLELIEDHFIANNVDFISMNEKFDTGTPFGRAMIGILAVFAQLEREQIKERLIMGREGRAKDGYFHGGRFAPIGYEYIKETGELAINEYEAMQVKEFFDLYLSGKSFRNIEKIFMDKGYTHQYGKWIAASMKKTVQNTVYIGQVRFDDKEYQGVHEPIIDKETFEKANQIYDNRSEIYSKYKRATGITTYLGGLLKCKHCQGKYGMTRYRSGNAYYCCYSRRKQNRAMIKDPNCKNKNYRMETLDKIVFEEIRKLATDPDYIHEIKQNNFSQEDVDKESILKREIAKIDGQKSRFMDLYGLGEFTINEVQEKVEPLNEQKRKLENELERLVSGKSEMSEQEVINLVSNFGDILDRNNFDEIRLVIDSLIDEVLIDNEDIIIQWKFA